MVRRRTHGCETSRFATGAKSSRKIRKCFGEKRAIVLPKTIVYIGLAIAHKKTGRLVGEYAIQQIASFHTMVLERRV